MAKRTFLHVLKRNVLYDNVSYNSQFFKASCGMFNAPFPFFSIELVKNS